MNSFRALPILLFIWHFTAFSNVLSYDFNLTQPLLWETSSIPVVSTYVDVILNLKVLNPCERYVNLSLQLNNRTIVESRVRHVQLCNSSFARSMRKIKTACSPEQNDSSNNIFELDSFSYIPDNSSTLPLNRSQQRVARSSKTAAILNNRLWNSDKRTETKVLSRSKRFGPLLAIAGGVAVGGVIIVGAVVVGKMFFDVRELKANVGNLNDKIAEINRNLDLAEKKFNNLTTTFPNHTAKFIVDFDWIHGDAKAQIDHNDRIYEAFFREFADGITQHFDLPFPGLAKILCSGTNMTVCAPATWQAKGCDLSGENNDTLQLRMRLPQQAPQYKIVYATPFSGYSREGKKWCQHKYIGPETKIVWNNGTCSEEINIPREKKFYEQYLPLPDDCDSPTDGSDNALWTKVRCFSNDRKLPVKLQRCNNQFVLYCPGRNITIRSQLVSCPMAPFFVTPEDGVILDGKPLPFDRTLVFNVTFLPSSTTSFDLTGKSRVPSIPFLSIDPIAFERVVSSLINYNIGGFSWWLYLIIGVGVLVIYRKFFPNTFRRREPVFVLPGNYKY